MDSLAPFHITLSTPVTQVYWCFYAFLSYLFSIESVPARLHCLHMYVSSLLREIHSKKAETTEALLQKVMICNGIVNLIEIVKKTTSEAVESRSRPCAGVAGIDFPYGFSSHGTGKDFEMGVGSRKRTNLNHFMGQSKMSVENGRGPGGNLFQHSISTSDHIWKRGDKYALGELRTPLSLNENKQSQMSSTSIDINLGQFLGQGLETVAGGSGMLLSPLGKYPQVNPTIININLVAPAGTNINHVSFVRDAAGYNYASDEANQPRPQDPQQHTQRPKRMSWTTALKAKFENAVAMLGGSKWATAKRIWRYMEDDNLTIRQVNSYLRRYRKEERKIEEISKQGHP